MKKFLLITIYLIHLSCAYTVAQNPSWANKAAKAVFTVKTFKADGTLIASSNGFFISENGDAVSLYSPFVNAHRAVVIDAQGKELPVKCILGANEMYDVIKFRVSTGKVASVNLAANNENSENMIWLLPYAMKKTGQCRPGTIESIAMFMDNYAYYTILQKPQENTDGCPYFNQKGEVVGISQPATTQNNKSYAISAQFARELKINGLSFNDNALKKIYIKKAIPSNSNDALLALFMAGANLSKEDYAVFLNDFIQEYPLLADGYIYRAKNEADNLQYTNADKDITKAIEIADKKDDAHYNYAQMIVHKAIYHAEVPFAEWTLEKAMEESKKAWEFNPAPIYRQQQAQILYMQKKYEDACNVYMELAQSPLRSPEHFYSASQCKQQLGDQTAAIALLDSAVNTFSKPYVKTAAPYIFARAQALYEAGKYRPAVADYNEYERIMMLSVNDQFYYIRHQAEVAGHLYQQALDDINKAIELSPSTPLYYAERASLEIRVGRIDDAIKSANECIRINPHMSEGYLLLGLAQCQKGNKSEGAKNLNKAKELGNSQAQMFIDKYAK